MTQKELRAILEDALREEAAMVIREWDRLLGFVRKNNLPNELIDVALDHRLRLMALRDGDSKIPIDSKK